MGKNDNVTESCLIFRIFITGKQTEICTDVLTKDHVEPETRNYQLRKYQLQSSQSNQLIVPPVKLSTYGPCSFAVAGPTIWNNVPEYLCDPELSIDEF